MPLYEYQCDVCGHVFEKRRAAAGEGEQKCPVCGESCHRVYSPFSSGSSGYGSYCAPTAPS